MLPGERLKDVRNRLGVTTREVEGFSRQLADSEGNEEFFISNAWVTQIENTRAVPSIYKLFSLAVVLRIRFPDLLLLYGIDLEKVSKYQTTLQLDKTHLSALEVYDQDRPVSFPVRFDRGFSADKTSFISRIVEVWGEVPISLIQHLDIKRGRYGYIGLKDYSLYPLLRPGSFVQIDDQETMVRKALWRSEYDRPIYFVELRDGFACSWCELNGHTLTLIPHPLSPCSHRQLEYPAQAEIVGRVTAVAMRIVDHHEQRADEPARLPARP